MKWCNRMLQALRLTKMVGVKRRVVLHFDLNRTILMSDAAGGRSMEDTVNYLLSECTWGRVIHEPGATTQWRCVSDVPTVVKPSPSQQQQQQQSATAGAPAAEKPEIQDDDIMTYKRYVDMLFPYKSLQQQDMSIDQVKAFNKAAKQKRTELQAAFTNANAPGASVANAFAQVLHQLHFPDATTRQNAFELAQTLPDVNRRLQQTWQSGRLYLLPSFINLLFVVAQHQARHDQVELQLVLRTFGDDAVDVAKEMEFLVEGTHPLCYGKKLPECFRLHPQAFGTFYRHGFDSQGSVLVVGTLSKIPFDSDSNPVKDDVAIRAFYGSEDVKLFRGFQSIQNQLQAMYQHHAVVALRDYWEWWNVHGEDERYGKLLLVDSKADQATARVIFLDDHIEHTHAHIVDVREVTTGNPIAFADAKDRFLHRVEPFLAITDTNYFVDLVNKLLASTQA